MALDTFPYHSTKSLKRDGFLRLYNSHLGDFLEVEYEINGTLQDEGLKKINRFMRSRDSGEEIEMNLELIRLIDHIQDHFRVDTVEIISGYRSPLFNRALKNQGRGVADHSYHTIGYASDIHLDEINEKKVARYARRLKKGGVGYYPDFLMVHLDVGRIGSWQDGRFTNRTDIGIFNSDIDLSLKTDQLFYLSKDKQKLTLHYPQNLVWKPKLSLEWFFRGEWKLLGKLLLTNQDWRRKNSTSSNIIFSLQSSQNKINLDLKNWVFGAPLVLPYGKFRWKISTQNGRVQYSNEFYLKQK